MTKPRVLTNPYDEYDEGMKLHCSCGWTGTAKQAGFNLYHTVFDLSCPKCLEMLLVVPHPTHQQTIEAARAGNEEAVRDLATLEKYGVLDRS